MRLLAMHPDVSLTHSMEMGPVPELAQGTSSAPGYFFSTPRACTANAAVAAVTALHFGTISYLGTDADFGVNIAPSNGNNESILSASITVSTISTSPLIVLGYGKVRLATRTLRAGLTTIR